MYSVKMSDNKQLFYLTGFQRSGTTLFCQLLDKHPEILCSEEPEFAKRIFYDQHEKLKDLNNDSIIRNLKFYNVNQGDYLKLVAKFADREFSNHQFLYEAYQLMNCKNAPLIGAKEVIDIVSDKFSFITRLIDVHPNDTKFIFIERNIKGVVASFIKMGFYPPGKKRLNNFNMKRFAKKYMQITQHAKSIMPVERTLFIRFEELMHNPEKVLKNAYTFLGVNSDKEIVQKVLNTPRQGVRHHYSGIKSEVEDSWKKLLTPKQVAYLDALCSEKF